MAGKKKGSNLDAYNEEFRFNKIAFDDIIGDPFALSYGLDIGFDGNYFVLAKRSVISAMDNDFDRGQSTRNAAQPSVTDFLCDVDLTVSEALSADELLEFEEVYVWQSRPDALTPKERMQIEQRLGKLFRQRKLSPVTRYFKTIRQSVGSLRAKERTQGRFTI